MASNCKWCEIRSRCDARDSQNGCCKCGAQLPPPESPLRVSAISSIGDCILHGFVTVDMDCGQTHCMTCGENHDHIVRCSHPHAKYCTPCLREVYRQHQTTVAAVTAVPTESDGEEAGGRARRGRGRRPSLKWRYYQESANSGMEYLDMSFATLKAAMAEAKRGLQWNHEVKQKDGYSDEENVNPANFPIKEQPIHNNEWDPWGNCVYELPDEDTTRDLVLLTQTEGCTQYVATEEFFSKKKDRASSRETQ